ncbi:MAG: hypothetical protein ACJ8NS_05605 [Chthoniobacterales bacterium]|jgi:hypothetical protein
MNPHSDGKPEPNDPDQVLRLLEIELAQSRAARQRAGTPFRGFRLASFVFLFAVIIGAVVAFYYVFVAGGLDDLRNHNSATSTATPSAHAP